jgi:hypothetical protein
MDPADANSGAAPWWAGWRSAWGSVASLAFMLCLASCGTHRSTADLASNVPIPPGTKLVRIEIENGTVGIAAGTEAAVVARGGLRRQAQTAEGLAALAVVPAELQVDPTAPAGTLLLRAPRLPAGAIGVLAVELGIHLPPDLPVELVITGSGHVTMAGRTGATKAETGRGDLRFEGCAGGVSARTGRGNVIVFEHRGELDVHTMVGDMQAFVREPARRIRLVTGQGTVQLLVPAATPFDVDARAELGKIGNGFGLVAQKVARYGAAMVGRQGAGSVAIVLRTGAGHLAFSPKSFD